MPRASNDFNSFPPSAASALKEHASDDDAQSNGQKSRVRSDYARNEWVLGWLVIDFNSADRSSGQILSLRPLSLVKLARGGLTFLLAWVGRSVSQSADDRFPSNHPFVMMGPAAASSYIENRGGRGSKFRKVQILICSFTIYWTCFTM